MFVVVLVMVLVVLILDAVFCVVRSGCIFLSEKLRPRFQSFRLDLGQACKRFDRSEVLGFCTIPMKSEF